MLFSVANHNVNVNANDIDMQANISITAGNHIKHNVNKSSVVKWIC